MIIKAMQDQVSTVKSTYCILVIPLLLETQTQSQVDRILVVDAPEQLQIARTNLRDQLSETEIKKIMQAQINREQRLSAAADIIN